MIHSAGFYPAFELEGTIKAYVLNVSPASSPMMQKKNTHRILAQSYLGASLPIWLGCYYL